MSKRSGVSLIELMLSLVILVILTGALSEAYAFGSTYLQKSQASRLEEDKRIRLEDRLRELFHAAYIAPTANNAPAGNNAAGGAAPPAGGAGTATNNEATSYFVGGLVQGGQQVQNATADRVTFTVCGLGVPGAYMSANNDDDFNTLNQKFGPQGGMSEVSLGLTPVGTATDQQGLFLREQTPADGDLSQGGYETCLDPDVAEISYEFWDGQTWETSWDTTSGEARLPAAVRITYRLTNEDTNRLLVIQLSNSDVTADNPAQQGTGNTTGPANNGGGG